jgi:hypothetical protein
MLTEIHPLWVALHLRKRAGHMLKPVQVVAMLLLMATGACAQVAGGPMEIFTQPIEATRDVVRVRTVELAALPDIDGVAARMMLLVDEPGTSRLFVNDMRGPLYTVSRDGKSVALYLDVNAPEWGVAVQSQGRGRGFQSFAFHPQFGRAGAAGYGKFYTYLDTSNKTPKADFVPGGGDHTHDTVLLEWTAKNPAAAKYDGAAPRELIRIEQPFQNHNAGLIAFNPNAAEGAADFGLLYIGSADGGNGGDPLNMAQNRSSIFGKILRIDPLGNGPLGRNSANGKYGIPPGNPYVADNNAATLGEIYAIGMRNPQRFSWDPKNGQMYMADIGQGNVEKISAVTLGANLGWNKWEGSYPFVSRTAVKLENLRGDREVTFPIAEYDHRDPILQSRASVTIGYVVRSKTVPQLENLLLFGDIVSGEVFYLHADKLPQGGQDGIRRVLFAESGETRTYLQLLQAKNRQQGKPEATRADVRFGQGADGRIFLLNKADGVIRVIVPN